MTCKQAREQGCFPVFCIFLVSYDLGFGCLKRKSFFITFRNQLMSFQAFQMFRN